MRRRRTRGKSAPSYRLHKGTGQAVVTIFGTTHYLGKFNTEASQEKYRRLLAELWSAKGQDKKTPKPKPAAEVTISSLAIEYATHAKAYYVKNGKTTSEWHAVRRVMKSLRGLYGSTSASEFGPLRYQAFRQTFIDADLARTTINRYMFHTRRMFQHAAKDEVVPMSYFWRLRDVGNLVEGRTEARETDDVLPVDGMIVKATLPELTPTVAAMVELQMLTGMRPGEVIQLRPCDINRSGEVWTYQPPSHKNQHKKSRLAKTRIVAIGPKAQRILTPFLLRDHQTYCFTPREAYLQHQERRHRERQTPMNQGNQPKVYKPKGFKPSYCANSYRVAIQRAAMRAFPPSDETKANETKLAEWQRRYRWSPNQLRHSAATLAREKYDLETAQQVCGHSEKRTTEKNYAEIDLTRAVEFARKFG